ncbi:endonuclease III [bacterium]|nr:endonuclease III [bacterium]
MNTKNGKKINSIYRALKKLHPDAKCELNYKNSLELLVATILSAQCTDVRVNLVTADLFKKFKKPEDYLKATPATLEKLIRSTGFYKNKAKSIRGAMTAIIKEHGNKVPDTMEELVKLPGVGRKTANVILGNAFSKPGLPVDTHVTRLCNRFGICQTEDAVKIEAILNKLLAPKDWCKFSHVLIFHGRRVCKARNPLCESCPITKECDYFKP